MSKILLPNRTFIISVFVFLSSICTFNVTFGQVLVNDIIQLEEVSTLFTESAWADDTLFVFGTSGFNNGWKACIVKYLRDGSMSDYIFLSDTSSEFQLGFWDRGLYLDNDTFYHTLNKGYDNTIHGVIIKLDRNGNILTEKEYNSYYFPDDDYSRFRDLIKTNTGFFILDIAIDFNQLPQTCLLYTDNQFNQKWRKCYGENNLVDTPNDIEIKSNGNVIVLSNTNDLEVGGYFEGPGNAFHRAYIFEVDTLGKVIEEWESTSRIEGANAGYLKNDSILIVAAGIGKEQCTDSQSNALCFFIWIGGVYELNLISGEKNWQTSLSGGAYGLMSDSRFMDIIPSIENDGYILCGAGYYEIPDCRTDTIDKCWAAPGIIAKVSNNGDSLWLRKIFGVTDIYESNILYDVEITPDSGYSFIGEAFNPWPGETQGQFGWFLMTDKYGCLVPGCHLITSSDDEKTDPQFEDTPFNIYPNPANEILSVLITRSLKQNASLHLSDPLGKVIDSWNNFEKGATYMIPVSHLSPGMYILTLKEDNRIIGSQQVIIN